MAGVSTASVSRALNDDPCVSDITKENIKNIARLMDYQPKKYRKRKPGQINTSCIGLIVPCSYPWFNFVIRGLRETLMKRNILVLIADTNDDTNQETICLETMKDLVGGLIVSSASETNTYGISTLKKINSAIPVVTVFRNANIDHIDSIDVDCYNPTYELLEQMLDNGHRHIAIITGPMGSKPNLDRLRAYTQVLKSRKIPIRNHYIYYGEINEESGYNYTRTILTQNPEVTAIFATSVPMRGCLRALDEHNKIVPDDISLVSLSDETMFSFKGVGLTAIQEPYYECGRQAAALLLERLEERKLKSNLEARRIIVTPDIQWRGSDIFPIHKVSPPPVPVASHNDQISSLYSLANAVPEG